MKKNYNLTNVLTGVEILNNNNFNILKNKKIGVITNHTGILKNRTHIIDALIDASINIKSIFSPEHGIFGNIDMEENISDSKYKGIYVYSLYGETKKPTPTMLKDIDILLFDIQDVGVRYYTYITTMALSMEAAKENNIKFIVCDRPNPVTGVRVEGNLPTPKYSKIFVSYFPLPVVHGMTVGELAKLFNEYYKIECDLYIIKMKGWERKLWYDETDLPWINPSPNIKNITQAILYPAAAFFEGKPNVSEGRGTEHPFEFIGAPWIDKFKLATYLKSRNISGVDFEPIDFIPKHTLKYNNELCHGIRIKILDRYKLQVIKLGIELVSAIHSLYPDKLILTEKFDRLAGDPAIRKMITESDLSPEEIINTWQDELEKFKEIRKKYLLY